VPALSLPNGVSPMIYSLVAASATLIIVVLVYLRRVNRRQVASLFLSTVRQLQAEGMDEEHALRQGIGRFIRRPPFNLLQTDELTLLVHVLQDLGSPVDVGAEVLQQCEHKRSIMELKEQKKLMQLLYMTDLKLSLQQLIENAELLHGKAADRYPNIAIALMASLSARKGWTFAEELNDALIFNYRQQRVRISKQGSGKDAAKRILFEEMVRRPMSAHPETDQARSLGREKMIDSFDSFFDETFLRLGKIK
jgi:hypothetical protein